MKLLKESMSGITVREIKEILTNALEKLDKLNDNTTVTTVSNTYHLGHPNAFLGIASVGYVDLDNPTSNQSSYYIVKYYNEDGQYIEVETDEYEDTLEQVRDYAEERLYDIDDAVGADIFHQGNQIDTITR